MFWLDVLILRQVYAFKPCGKKNKIIELLTVKKKDCNMVGNVLSKNEQRASLNNALFND